MNIYTIVALVLGGIGTILGLINQFWGSGILLRRERVILREPELNVKVREEGGKIQYIIISGGYKLVRVRGEQNLYLESTYLQLSKEIYRELEPYFEVEPNARINGSIPFRVDFYRHEEYKTLKFNEPKLFDTHCELEPKSALKEIECEIQNEQSIERVNMHKRTLQNLKDKAMKLSLKYMIVWIDGKGKKWPYRIPNKWFDRFIPEKIWW